MGIGWEVIYRLKPYMYVIMSQRITVYIDDELLSRFDDHIGIIKRSTAISQLMKNEIEYGGGLVV